ncbi:ATPase involved in DNA repair, partial [mine drainage metagenome]
MSETRAEQRERFQKVVNDQMVFQLTAIVSELAEKTIQSDQYFTFLVIDDLDLTWVEDSLANVLIKCLLQVALEMQRAEHIKIVIALRTNIFDQLEVGRQARGGQEEKLRATAMVLGWT